MKCIQCGKELATNAKFCTNCGSEIVQNKNSEIENAINSNVGYRAEIKEQIETATTDDDNKKLPVEQPKTNWNDKYTIMVIIGAMMLAALIGFAVKKYNSKDTSVDITDYNYEEDIMEDEFGDADQEMEVVNESSIPEQSELLDMVQRKYSQAAVSYEGHVYAIFNYKSEGLETWNECREFCEKMDGHLAVINTEEENEFVYRFVRDSGLHVAAFGYTDQYEEGNWEWVDGTISDYENWAEGQPNNGKNNRNNEEENYAEFYKERNDGTWNDAPFGANTYRFICEWE